MRVTVGSTLLGDYEADRPIGGFVASATGQTDRGRGTCSGLGRLRARGNVVASFTVPTKLAFESVSAAQKWINDLVKAGLAEGLLRFEYDDGSETKFPWAVARPSQLTHAGVLVSATWQIEAGERLI
jgi:hypothetical protein